MTVLIATRDRLAMLREAIGSALSQEVDELEVLVVDDGSGEATRAWLRRHAAAEPRLRVVETPHAGVGAARDRGLREARGRIVTILDSDDRLEPGALRRLVDALERDGEASLVYGDIRRVLPDGRGAIQRYPRFRGAEWLRWSTLLSPRVPFKHSGMTFRRDVARAAGGYDAALAAKIDVDFVLRMARVGRLQHVGGLPVVTFLDHPEAMSRRRIQGLRAWFVIIDRHGPRSRLGRAAVKATRATSELLKVLAEQTRR